MDQSQQETHARKAVSTLIRSYQLSDHQLAQFESYLLLLQEWNKKINLTAVDDDRGIVSIHFNDSLQLSKCMDVSAISSLADVGTGAGFPGLALKIMYPHLNVLLIEVVQKKIEFLDAVIAALGLEDVQICGLDWRNFLRNTEFDIDLFVSRAALPVEELIRLFKPSCRYKDAELVYWASRSWKPTSEEQAFIEKEYTYAIENKGRKLVFFKKK